MNTEELQDGFDLAIEATEISFFIRILKDSVQDNEDSYYLFDFVEIIEEKFENLIKNLEEYNLKISQKIKNFQE